jgi:hypothetical protein
MARRRKGTLSAADKRFITENMGRLAPEEIAEKLDRTLQCVLTFIHEKGEFDKVFRKDNTEHQKGLVLAELKKTIKWKRLRREFTTDEIEFFEEEYWRIMSQFKGDVLPTEETQIIDSIRFDILKNRNMSDRRRALEDLSRYEKTRQDFLRKFPSVNDMSKEDRVFLSDLEDRIQAAAGTEQARTTEYVKLQERQDAITKSMKATRDQRVKQIENNTNFIAVIKMLQDRDIQESEARQMELMKLSAEKAREKLGRPIKYDDGNMDNPILSADTVDLGPEENDVLDK